MPIINGMIRAANALHYYERRQEIASNNLANSETVGFKAERVFARMVDDAVPIAGVATDFRAGPIRETGSPLDLALPEEGFFVVETANGERFTRGGSFSLDAEGRIVDTSGNPLLGDAGPIVVGAGSVDIDARGTVRVNGAEVDRIRVERAPAGVQLQHEAGTLFVPDQAREVVPPEERSVKQGSLEESNVSTIDSMVDLISIQRAYSAVQKAVTTLDDVRNTISNQLGKV